MADETTEEQLTRKSNPDCSTFELITKRLAKREFLAPFLPFDLLCKHYIRYSWGLGGELLKRRHSEVPGDKAFFKAVSALKKHFKSYEQHQNELDKLLEDLNSARWPVISELKDAERIYEIFSNLLGLDDEGLKKESRLLLMELGSAVFSRNPDLSGKIVGELAEHDDYESYSLLLALDKASGKD